MRADKIYNFSKAWLWPLLLIVIGLAIYGKGLRDEDVFYPDADRIAMDGVYFYDLLKDLPVTHLYDYTVRYYARYPALSLGFREPFFPLVVGIFYRLFGIAMSTAKLAVLAFAAFGISLFYKLACGLYGARVAVLSTLLFITTPFVSCWARVPMAEIPALAMTIGSIYYFYKYAESGNARTLPIFFTIVALTLWTKRTAGFLFLFFALYLAVRRKWKLLFRREALIGCLFLLMALAPLAIITVWLGNTLKEFSLGPGTSSAAFSELVGIDTGPRLSLVNLLYYIKILYREQITPLVLFLSMIALAVALLKKERRAVLFIAWIAAVYITTACLKVKNPRHTIYWIPAFCILAASVAEGTMPRRKSLTFAASLLLTGVIAFQMFFGRCAEPWRASGFREAAKYVTDNPKGYTIFVEGYGNGLFIFWVRKFDASKRWIVLRGDKLLASSVLSHTYKLKVHINSADEIYRLFRKYGTTYVVVEERDTSGIPIFSILRDLLKGPQFRLVKKIPVESDDYYLRGQNLLIYERVEKPDLPKGELVIPLPIVGKTLRLPIEELAADRGVQKRSAD